VNFSEVIENDDRQVNFRIAHISDTHISPEYNRQNIIKLKSLLAYIVDGGYDHLVITGDIAGHGEERDFRSVRRLLKYFDLLDYEKLSVTIGNHDVFGGVHRAEDLFSFGKHCRSVVYKEKLDQFERALKETFPIKPYEGERLFPFVKIVGPVALIGMNSVRKFHPLHNPFGSNGYVSDRQLNSVEKILSHPSIADLKKIILIHHHFDKYQPYAESFGNKLYHMFEARTLKLLDRKKVEETFKKYGVDAVLHGHTHIDEVYSNANIRYSSTALNWVRAKSEKRNVRRADQLSFNEIVISEDGTMDIRRRSAEIKRRNSRTFDKKVFEE